MTAVALRAIDSFSGISNIAARLNRHFNRIGYARAARELRRAGYPVEADNCIKLMKEL